MSTRDGLPANMVEAFRHDHGRDSEPREIEQLYLEGVDQFEASDLAFVIGTARIYGKVMEKLGPMHLQAARAKTRTGGLLTGDSPVVIQRGLRVGTREGVGIFDSDLVYLPASRWMAVALTMEPVEDRILTPADVQRLNLLMRRSCLYRLAAPPSEDIPRGPRQACPCRLATR